MNEACAVRLPSSRRTFVPLSEPFVEVAARAERASAFVLLSEPFVEAAARAERAPAFVLLSEPFVGLARDMAPERQLVELAARQHGALATWQLLAAGLSRNRIAGLVARGWLRPVHRGVYLAGPVHGPLARLMAAALAVGEGAVLSHRSAAELWELGAAVRGAVTVTTNGRASRSRDGISVHHTRRLAPDDVASHRGVPVTSPARTLLDLATQIARHDLARAVEEAEVAKLVRGDWLDPLLARNPRHRGAGGLRQTVQGVTHPAMTRSEAERRMLALLRAARLPAPEVNQRIHGYEVDFAWPDQQLAVEVDGYAFHSSRGSFERDRRRDADLSSRGWRVIRITWSRLTREPEAVVALLAAALSRRRVAGSPGSGAA